MRSDVEVELQLGLERGQLVLPGPFNPTHLSKQISNELTAHSRIYIVKRRSEVKRIPYEEFDRRWRVKDRLEGWLSAVGGLIRFAVLGVLRVLRRMLHIIQAVARTPRTLWCFVALVFRIG